MKSALKRILSSPVFIAGVAFAVRMLLMCLEAGRGPNPVRIDAPYGYELGRVARAIAAGQGFSSPLRMVNTGPTVWFTPIYPYLVAGIFKMFGIYSYLSEIVIQVLNSAFASLTIIPIHAIAKKTFGNNAAIGAAWTWVLFPTALFFPIMWIWDTALAALFFALIFWATLALRDRNGPAVLGWLRRIVGNRNPD